MILQYVEKLFFYVNLNGERVWRQKKQQWRRCVKEQFLSLYVILECISTHLLSTNINIPLYSIYE